MHVRSFSGGAFYNVLQVQGQILLNQGTLSFGLERYATSEFELLAEELLMSDSLIRVSAISQFTYTRSFG